MGSTSGAFTHLYLTRTEWICWLCYNPMWQHVLAITDSVTEERFPGGFGTSWDVLYTSGASEKTTGYLHVPFSVNSLYA